MEISRDEQLMAAVARKLVYSKLSVVIPAYNEIDTIHYILRRVSSVRVGLEKEIILVDDCSTDGTRNVLKRIHDGH